MTEERDPRAILINRIRSYVPSWLCADPPLTGAGDDARAAELAGRVLAEIKAAIDILMTDAPTRAAAGDRLARVAELWPMEVLPEFSITVRIAASRPQLEPPADGARGGPAGGTEAAQKTINQFLFVPPDVAPIDAAEWLRNRLSARGRESTKYRTEAQREENAAALTKFSSELLNRLRSGRYYPDIRKIGSARVGSSAESLRSTGGETPNALDMIIRIVDIGDSSQIRTSLTLARIMILYSVEREIERLAATPIVRHDAGKITESLLCKMVGGERYGGAVVSRETGRRSGEWRDGHFYVFQSREGLQLSFPCLPDPSQALIDGVRRIFAKRAGRGLRAYAALNEMATEDGSTGDIAYTSARLYDSLQLGGRARYGEEGEIYRAIVEQYTTMILWVDTRYETDRGRSLWRGKPIFEALERYQEGGNPRTARSAMRLKINPWLYHGVRAFDEGGNPTSVLGGEFYPSPRGLAALNPGPHPYAIQIAVILSARLVWDMQKKKDALHISAGSIFEMLAINAKGVSPSRTARTIKVLEAELDTLCEMGLFSDWRWRADGNQGTWPRGMIEIFPSQLARDRIRHGIASTANPRIDPTPRTFGELAAWISARGWTDTHAARVLGVDRRTVFNYQKQPADRHLPERILSKIRALTGPGRAQSGKKACS